MLSLSVYVVRSQRKTPTNKSLVVYENSAKPIVEIGSKFLDMRETRIVIVKKITTMNWASSAPRKPGMPAINADRPIAITPVNAVGITAPRSNESSTFSCVI
jgi:hypothetical protein